jgi:aryl-alcohol dehydrogenase-like predicted oxidoreductase
MKRRMAGRTGLTLSELGLGCSSFWAKPVFPENQALDLVEAAIAGGVTFFDTGASYAAGNAERRLGLVLKNHRSNRDIVVATKVGTHVAANGSHYKDWSRAAVRESVERSLERLGVPRIDILHLHGPLLGDLTPELVDALEELRRADLVRFIGINSFDDDVIRAGLRLPNFDSFMIEYNVLKKRNGALIDEIAARDRAVLIGTPVAQALFTNNVFAINHLRNAWGLLRALRHHPRELATAFRYRFLNRVPGMSGPQAALAYVLRHPKISSAIFGTTQLAHLAQNVAAAALALPPDVAARIERLSDA